MHCPSCKRQLVEVEVWLGDTRLTMHSCSRCDQRWWDRDGELIELRDVLALAAAHR